MRCPDPGPPGSLWFHSISSVAVARGAIFRGSVTRASVVRRPSAVGIARACASIAACAACSDRAPSPAGPLGPPRLTESPFTRMRVMRMPSVTSDGTQGASCGVLPRKMFGSSRSTSAPNESGLSLWTTTVSRPSMREVATSSRARIV